MTENLADLKKEKLHSREITIETYSTDDDDRVVVEGRLSDRRYVETRRFNGEPMPAGKIHDIIVRFLIGGDLPVIERAEAEIISLPLDECRQTMESIDRLTGLPLSWGFSQVVKQKMAGIKGCVHLTGLVLAMGSASVQGFAAGRGRREVPPEGHRLIMEFIKNSCYVWREAGETWKTAASEIGVKGSPKNQK